MIIRPAVPADAAPLVAFLNPWITNTAITFTTEPKTEQGFVADIAARGDAFLVAEEGGRLVGLATYFPFRGGPGYRFTKEHTIVLSPEMHGKGAGRALMTALEGVARSDGVQSLIAGVSGENPDGIAFHGAIGFAEVARLRRVGYKFGRWMDLVLMQKFL